MQLDQPVMWYAGPDYLRLTTKGVNDGGYTHEVYKRVARAVVAAGAEGAIDFEPWAWLGYYGERCASVAYGSGAQGSLLQVAGWQAQDEALLGAPWDNVARLDVQLSVWYENDVPGVARECARRSRAYSSLTHGARWKVRYIDGGDDGDTTYIGSRASDCYVRIYDKWRESGRDDDYLYCWRYEIELKGAQAAAAWQEKGATAHDPNVWARFVLSRLALKGIVVPGVRAANVAAAPPVRKEATTNDRRLAWLRNQVAPAIDKLLAAGVKLDTVVEVLGLTGRDVNERE